MSMPIHLYLLDIDPATERHLLSLTQRHLKLLLESGNHSTSPKRRAEIGQEIEAFRAERDSIIACLRKETEMQSDLEERGSFHQIHRFFVMLLNKLGIDTVTMPAGENLSKGSRKRHKKNRNYWIV